MSESSDYARRLALADSLRGSAMESAIRSLRLPRGSRGMDAGCGIGSIALQLARAVGPEGHVTGVDVNTEFLDRARRAAEEQGLADRVTFRQGDVNRLPFDDGRFDWAWSVDCVGYPALEPRPALKELARVVLPGGTVAILGWTSQQLLPGHLMLEARLNAVSTAYSSAMGGAGPEQHFARALGWFREAGLARASVQTFLGEVRAPLNQDVREALVSLFDMVWVGVTAKLSAGDLRDYQRLCRPESPDFILDVPEYYAFFTYTMFSGVVERGNRNK